MSKNENEDLNKDIDNAVVDDDELTIDEVLNTAYDEALAAEQAEEIKPSSEDKSLKAEDKSDKAASANQDLRQKGDTGRGEPKPQANDSSQSEQSLAVDAIEPPVSWRKDAKALWDKMPRELQQEAKRAEESARGDYLQKTRELSERETQLNNTFGDLPDVIKPYLAAWSYEGKTPGQVVSNLLEMQKFAAREPENFLMWYADNYGVDLSRIANVQRAGQNPANMHVNRQLTALQNQVASTQAYIKNQDSMRAAQENQALVNEVRAFRGEVDAGGKLLRPYLTDVQNEFRAYLPIALKENPQAAPKEIMQIAYERAIYANPSIRSKINAEMEAKRLSNIANDTAAAEKAGKLITGAAAGDDNLPDSDDLDAVIRYAYEQHAA